ncbi:SDR family NAD(P)-dependent oxidoreductase [Zeaxanthinibacter enoshimensis]|uniref:NAD(P)-dependent dehydrogenase (Short-subunit alcohol dehydrogenase family) n=1 Tax=Zeaxanthinibacter enoshimensis TaxID=392009 RepID=A0A4R6TPD9_9FLAO|nr:SDR family oxidoreductase [Zeaxanthinibacter enoshimensis]TDQ31231.1 NAD(P)-dependent dehydrogenase (short-subunit alcohol dehydrogenase family) [Zeaxanthinibacter enoshimensis]
MEKKILMIGGSHGIGKSIVEELQGENELHVASRSNDGLEGFDIQYHKFDVLEDELDTSSLPDQFDGFIYCPGSITLKPFKMLKMEDFRSEMELNFFSLVKVLQDVMPKMAEGGSVVLFSTVAVGTGMPYHASIAAAKGAIEGFARAMAAEYAPKIRVNVIAPSLVDTPLSSRLLSNEKKQEAMADRHPLKRFGKPSDIASMATFLLSDNSSWMTGQTLGVDGGMGVLNLN